MQTRRWINQGLPQTLQIATFLLYFGAFWAVLGNVSYLGLALTGSKLNGALFAGQAAQQIDQLARLFVVVGGVAAGYLIANNRRMGYIIGVAVAALPLLGSVLVILRFQLTPDLVGLLFDIALFALLLHPQSRDYVRLWFK